MAADEVLVGRVREHLSGDLSISERRMFGGLAVMCNGNMAAGVIGDRLMVRVGPEDWLAALEEQGVSEMDFTGRSLRGMVYVDSGALEGEGLARWLDRGIAFAGSLPAK
jgi:TfoX/Sxy family transcriptional regulator of competence genes